MEDIITSGVNIIRINPKEIKEVTKIIEKFGLDFDDAYQYFLAGRGIDMIKPNNLTQIVKKYTKFIR